MSFWFASLILFPGLFRRRRMTQHIILGIYTVSPASEVQGILVFTYGFSCHIDHGFCVFLHILKE